MRQRPRLVGRRGTGFAPLQTLAMVMGRWGRFQEGKPGQWGWSTAGHPTPPPFPPVTSFRWLLLAVLGCSRVLNLTTRCRISARHLRPRLPASQPGICAVYPSHPSSQQGQNIWCLEMICLLFCFLRPAVLKEVHADVSSSNLALSLSTDPPWLEATAPRRLRAHPVMAGKARKLLYPRP